MQDAWNKILKVEEEIIVLVKESPARKSLVQQHDVDDGMPGC